MAKSKSNKLPDFESLDDLVEFFDNQDLGAYWNQMPEVKFDVDIKRKVHLFAVDADLANRVMEIAKSKHTSSEALINIWLREKILEQA